MLKVNNLYKSYPEANGILNVITDTSVHIKKGEFVVIMGVSGAGKSTLLNLFGGLDVPDSGTVLCDNQNITELKGDDLASFRNKNIGFVFQFHYLLPDFNIYENVMMPLFISGENSEALRERGLKLIDAVGLKDRIEHRPSELSGGECQRVAIARALINSPKIVLADEPSGNLDRKNSEKVHQLLFDLSRENKQTTIIATHNEELASMADRVLNLSEGVLK